MKKGLHKFSWLWSIPARIVYLLLGGILLFAKRQAVFRALQNKYLYFAGFFGGIMGMVFVLFRVIRFLVRLYP
jgi:hypothetical protein